MRKLQILIVLILSINYYIAPQIINLRLKTASAQPANQIVSTQTPPSETAAQDRPPLGLTLFLISFCCILLLLVGVFVLGFVVRTQNQKKDKK